MEGVIVLGFFQISIIDFSIEAIKLCQVLEKLFMDYKIQENRSIFILIIQQEVDPIYMIDYLNWVFNLIKIKYLLVNFHFHYLDLFILLFRCILHQNSFVMQKGFYCRRLGSL